MNTNPMKRAAQWYYQQVFRDEAIRPRESKQETRLPSLLRTARSLETNTHNWQSRESIFLKQAKLLANYEDDVPYSCNIVRYYPTYQSLTDQELRCYFSWRTKVRQGDVRKTSLSFAFLYIYELINQIGAEDPSEGYRKLITFRDVYGQLDEGILPYMKRWLVDYVVYYGLDANLLADSRQVMLDRSITVLENLPHQTPEKVLFALRQLAPKWLSRSKFYAAQQADFDAVTVRILNRMHSHYDTRCKKTFTEQYFGKKGQYQVRLFDGAVFCDPLKRKNYAYVMDEQCVYRCEQGLWSVEKYGYSTRPGTKLEELLKTIDAVMRQEYGDKHPIKCEMDTKWVLTAIREEVRALLAEKKEAEAKKITIDRSQLDQIRADAAITRDKLIVDEELPEEEPVPETEAAPPELQADTPLSPAEYRLVQSLLYGQSYSWVQAEGHLLSVLVDGINEKLYDTFMDSVLDDSPALIDDYIDELKEMIKP